MAIAPKRFRAQLVILEGHLKLNFRFSIRDLLWLTLVIALAVGWFTDRQIMSRKIDSLQIDLWLSEHRIRPSDNPGFIGTTSNYGLIAPPEVPKK